MHIKSNFRSRFVYDIDYESVLDYNIITLISVARLINNISTQNFLLQTIVQQLFTNNTEEKFWSMLMYLDTENGEIIEKTITRF